MASNEGVQPLLADQSEFAAWDAVDLETQAETISDECTVHLMLQQHSQDALRFLQSGGIEKLAEFTAPVRNPLFPGHSGPAGAFHLRQLASVSSHAG